MRESNRPIQTRLPILYYLTLFLFVVTIVSAGLLYGIWLLSIDLGILKSDSLTLDRLLLLALIVSAIISTVVVMILGNRFIFKSIREVSDASARVAGGDYTPHLAIPKEREIGELVENFNHMTEQLSKKETLASNFITSISHEFKTPLATIRGYAQLLNEEIPAEKRGEYVSIITKKVDVLTDLVTNVLELSKLENANGALSREWFSLDEQIRKNILFLEPNWSEKQIEMIPELIPLRIYGNQELMGEIWQNLLDNAIRFTSPKGRIIVTMEVAEDCVSVAFRDTGVGMDEETQTHIFEKFYQGANQTSKKGSGLGLAITKQILEICGGTIAVQSAPGAGTTMRVNIPIYSGK
ncbi:MAG: HAMP domain-containing sensor histidine kinase [Eubacteriales bacterium]|nr:HAMP domain-containing sensor histidine kinase [Eubacteriales bacterium]